MYIIGINGFKRSGKGEVGKSIARNVLVGQVKQVGFADKVKIYGARALGFLDRTDEELIEMMDDAKEHWIIDFVRTSTEPTAPPIVALGHITGRQYLQNVGTEARKIFGDDFWVDQVLPNPALGRTRAEGKLMDLHGDHTDWLVITDLRFENEAQRVLDLGGEVWRVHRPGTESDGHASEQRLPDHLVTREIDNNGDLGLLAEMVDANLQLMEEGIR